MNRVLTVPKLWLLCLVSLVASVAFVGNAQAAPTLKISLTHENAWGVASKVDPYTGSATALPRGSGGNWYSVTVENDPAAADPTSGLVSVALQLPPGLVFSRKAGGPIRSGGNGWETTSLNPRNGSATFTRSDPLPPGSSYLPIIVAVHVERESDDIEQAVAAVSGGGAAEVASATDQAEIVDVPYGIGSLVSSAVGSDGVTTYSQAGGHPNQISGTVVSNLVTDDSELLRSASGAIRNVNVSLPAGLFGSPQSVPQCPLTTFNATVLGNAASGCAADTVVGFIRLGFVATPQSGPVFDPANIVAVHNLSSPPGHPATLGFVYQNVPFILFGKVRSDSDYGISVTDYAVAPAPAINASQLTVCSYGVTGFAPNFACAPSSPGAVPFITNPSDCSEPPVTTVETDSWENPGVYAAMQSYVDAPSAPPAIAGGPTTTTDPVATSWLTGCDQLTENWVSDPEYTPTVQMRPAEARADTPSAYDFNLHVPQPSATADVLATPALKKSTVTLPAGVSISPAAAAGLEACTEEQMGLTSESPIRFDAAGASCPEASKVGTAEVDSPLLPDPLQGSVYLAAQNANPFHSRFAMYLAIDDERQGVVVKLAGEVKPDPQTGRITAEFPENPQLPFEDLRLRFFGGPRAPLANPPVCGTATTTSALTPWSAADPDNPTAAETATPSDSFAVDAGPAGPACASTLQGRSFAPTLSAGGTNTKAGAASPFVFKIVRNDGEQELASIGATMPKGFAAVLKGVAQCSEAQIAAAVGNPSGAAEQANPSCPAGSRVGSLTTGAGAGSSPYYVTGNAYLAGPYKGAPLSLVFITPALAGPFDLGNVVVRAAAFVDPLTAQVTVESDQIPQILDGVPLRIRSVALRIDRPNFTLNPTSCEPMQVAAALHGSSGATSNPASRFQVADCASLAFKPKLTMSLSGAPPRRGGLPALKAVLTAAAGQANIGKATVLLPGTELLEQNHIRTVCTRDQFAADACPKGSIYGSARAFTPLLDQPLEGPVYLRSNGGARELPDLVAALDGQIDIDLVGYIDTVKRNGVPRIRNRFVSVPDAPVSKFVLTMQGGRKGLLANNTNLCKAKPRAGVQFDGQNGKVHDINPLVSVGGCGKKGR